MKHPALPENSPNNRLALSGESQTPAVQAVAIAWFMRDASFWKHPDTKTPKRAHLRHPSKKSKYGHIRALCGNIPLIDEQDGGEFIDPPDTMKCKRCLRCLGSY